MARASKRTLSLNLVILLLGLAIVGLIGYSVVYRSKFKIFVHSGEHRLEFDFDKNTNLSEVLDTLLTKKAEGGVDIATQQNLVKAVLENHRFYFIPSDKAADRIRRIAEIREGDGTREFVRDIRKILYDLDGPFSLPDTLMDAPDDRFLSAFEELYKKKPASPLLATLWEWNLNGKDFLGLRTVSNISLVEDRSLTEGVAATCFGSILLDKDSVITAGSEFVRVHVEKPKACEPISTKDLLDGKGTTIWISPSDLDNLRREATVGPAREIEDATLTPIPKRLTHTTPF